MLNGAESVTLFEYIARLESRYRWAQAYVMPYAPSHIRSEFLRQALELSLDKHRTEHARAVRPQCVVVDLGTRARTNDATQIKRS